jgi:hypothetical protein
VSTDTRKRNVSWRINTSPEGYVSQMDAHLAVLMDLRDELQAMRRRLDCYETIQIPGILREIRRNTAKPRKRKPVQKKGKGRKK